MLSNKAWCGSAVGAVVGLAVGLSACASKGEDEQVSSPETDRDAAADERPDSRVPLGGSGGSDARDDGGASVPDSGATRDAGARPDASQADVLTPLIRAGVVLDDDSTIWCEARATGEQHGELEVFFRRSPSDAQAAIEEPFRFDRARARGRITCSERADGGGQSATVTTGPSRDEDDDVARARCPDEMPYGRDIGCGIEPFDESAPDDVPELRTISMPALSDAHGVPFAPGDSCIGSITESQPLGQVTGFVAEHMNDNGAFSSTLPLENEDLMRAAQVGGTDEGATFLAQGKLWFVFGDTSALDANDPLTVALQGPGLWRSNVLAYTSDFDVRDGYRFDGFETLSGSTMAAERVLSPHDTEPGEGAETTAIPLAGFGFTSAAGEAYRFLWFVSINTWDPNLVGPMFSANYSSLAYVVGGDPMWTRIQSPPAPPHADFGPGAVWFDRYARKLYFLGITPDRGPLKLARVASTFEAVIDPEQYEYWNGEGWVLGDASAAKPLIDVTSDYAPRSEISIAWNPAAQVWMLMLVNWYAAAAPPNQVELWQAPALIGPWHKVGADAHLPNGQHVLQYGPMINEHLFADGGLEIPYLLSQLFPVYNVYHHSYRINVAEGSACAHEE